jgi:hypothetical protein
MNRTIMLPAAAGAILVAALTGCGVQAATVPRPAVTHTVYRTVPAKPAAATTAPPTATAAPQTATTQPPVQAPAAPAPQFVNAEAVVAQYYQDITDQNYQAAWLLGGNIIGGSDYAGWVAGYATTASIALGTASDFGSDQVQAALYATQTDGSVRSYEGTYTVTSGVITAASIVQTG